jgi:hypothetical protein
MSRAVTGLIWAGVLAALIGFFLPWVRIDVHHAALLGTRSSEDPLNGITLTIRQGVRSVTGALPTAHDVPRQVSGAQIPQLVGSQQAQLAIAVMELVSAQPQHLRLKSYAVYLLPGGALLCGGLLAWSARSRAVAAMVAAVCAGAAALGLWKLLTMETQTCLGAISSGEGLWLSLGAYVGLSLAGMVRAASVGRVAR